MIDVGRRVVHSLGVHKSFVLENLSGHHWLQGHYGCCALSFNIITVFQVSDQLTWINTIAELITHLYNRIFGSCPGVLPASDPTRSQSSILRRSQALEVSSVSTQTDDLQRIAHLGTVAAVLELAMVLELGLANLDLGTGGCCHH